MSQPQKRLGNQVPFVSVAQMADIVDRLGVEPFLVGLTGYLEQDFLRWSEFDKSPRYASHSPDGVIELMPTSDARRFSFKYVNGHPGNTARGLQTVTAFGVLADVDSGYPLLVSEMTILTALRTAAASALAAKYLAPRASATLALIGNGAQAEFQALAFKAVLGVTGIRLYDTDPAATRKTAANLADSGLDIAICQSTEEALQGADIITTCTADKRKAVILRAGMTDTGVHINAIGGDCPGKTELDLALLQRARVFVEYEPQTRIEGDIQLLDAGHPVTELWRVVAGEAQGRVGPDEITVFDGVGFASEDYSALRYLYDLLAVSNRCQQLDLLADPADPKDLYGFMRKLSAGRVNHAA